MTVQNDSREFVITMLPDSHSHGRNGAINDNRGMTALCHIGVISTALDVRAARSSFAGATRFVR
jgi:hypothetical protein